MHRTSDGRTRRLAIALGVALVLLLSACSSSATRAQGSGSAVTVGTTPTSERPAGPPRRGGSLTFGIAADTNSLNPYVGQWAESAYIEANAIFEPLAAVGTRGVATPYLARSITSNASFTQWTIGLRPGITFQDGEPLDAAAVVTNLDAARKGALTSAALRPITAVTATDARTVVITTSTPWSTFPQTMTSQAGYMAAPAMLDAPDPATADPIGTGPFAFKSRAVGSELVVTRNPRYWQPGEPYLDSITFRVIPDDTSRTDAMAAGDLQAQELATPQALSASLQASQAGHEQTFTNAGQESNEYVIALNTSTPPFDDLLARQVVAAAVDQQALAQTLTGGVWPAAWGNFEPGSPYYLTPAQAGYPSPSPARARQLAAQYQRTQGHALSFTFMVNADALSARLGQVVQQQLGQAGVSVTIKQVEQVASITDVLQGSYQAAFFAMLSAPSLNAAYNFIASRPTPGISLNYTRLYDPAITKAMDAARATDDRQAQIEQYDIVQRRMAVNLDHIFLYHVRTADAFANQVHGFTTATFPGSTERAFAPEITYPFFTAMWISR